MTKLLPRTKFNSSKKRRVSRIFGFNHWTKVGSLHSRLNFQNWLSWRSQFPWSVCLSCNTIIFIALRQAELQPEVTLFYFDTGQRVFKTPQIHLVSLQGICNSSSPSSLSSSLSPAVSFVSMAPASVFVCSGVLFAPFAVFVPELARYLADFFFFVLFFFFLGSSAVFNEGCNKNRRNY